jgi:hypothetical protein
MILLTFSNFTVQKRYHASFSWLIPVLVITPGQYPNSIIRFILSIDASCFVLSLALYNHLRLVWLGTLSQDERVLLKNQSSSCE